MTEEFPWRNLDDHRSMASAALSYANSARHNGAGYSVRLTLSARTFEAKVLHESPNWIVLADDDTVTFAAKSAIQAMEILR